MEMLCVSHLTLCDICHIQHHFTRFKISQHLIIRYGVQVIKKAPIIAATAILILLALSACARNKGEVAEEDSLVHPAPTVITTRETSVPTSTAVQGNQVGNLALDFKLNNLEGKPISLSDFRGKAVLLDFWVTWCPHCQAERPLIQQIYDKSQNKDYVVLTVDILSSRPTETPTNLADFMKTNNYTFPPLLDQGMAVTRSYGVKVTPTHFLIDKNGIIREIRSGPYTSESEFEESLK